MKSDILRAFSVSALPKIEIGEYGGAKLYARRITGAELDQFRKAEKQQDAFLLCLSLCDERGERVFDDADVDRIGVVDIVTLKTWTDAVVKINHLDAKASEETAGN